MPKCDFNKVALHFGMGVFIFMFTPFLKNTSGRLFLNIVTF